MIKREQLTEIGTFGHPHGINGELTAVIEHNVNPADLRCIIVSVDGIFVPFFISTVRPKGSNALLLTIDGIRNETEAAALATKTIYALKEEFLSDEETEDDTEGFYAEDLVGFKATDQSGQLTGEISGIDDSTENILFIVSDTSGKDILIPVADEYIENIDTVNNTVTFSLPDGFFDI